MKKILFLILVVLAWTDISAQLSSHTIKRGETFEIIARRYNITVEQLREANPDVDDCYVGFTLNLPESSRYTNHISTITPQDIKLADEASNYIKRGKYKKAGDIYTKAINKNPLATLYFGRGISYYNREKYKSAIDDFKKARLRPECTDEMKEKCEELISSAERLRAEQRARRGEAWGTAAAIFVGAAAMTASAVVANNSSTPNNVYMPPSSVNGFKRDTSLDYLLDPRFAMMQVQQQEIEEYETFKRLTGFNISLEEYRMSKIPGAGKQNMDYLLDPNFAMQQVQQQEIEEYETYKRLSGTDITLEQYRYLKYSSNNNQYSGDETHSIDNPSSNDIIKSSDNKFSRNRRECSACRGKGSIERNDGSISSYGTDGYWKKCDICGTKYWSTTFHRHENCKFCHGRGYIDY